MTAIELVSRELLLLAVVVCLGAFPARLLDDRYKGTTRWALAPLLGLCVGVSACTSLMWFFPARETAWCVPVLCAASVALSVAKWPLRRVPPTPNEPTTATPQRRSLVIELVQLVVVVIVVAAPLSYTFAVRQSVGPAGFAVGDSVGYLAEVDGMQHESIDTARHLVNSPSYASNIAQRYWSDYAGGVQELDIQPLLANLDSLVGFVGSDTQSAFLIALLVIGGLDALVFVRVLSGRPTWAAVFAGASFAGAGFLQLFFDGSDGAIAGLVLIVPVVLFSVDAVRRPSPRTVLLAALLLGGLLAAYPLFVPEVGLAAGAVLLGALLRGLLRSSVTARSLAESLIAAVLIVIFAAVLAPVSTVRALRYWNSVVHGGFSSGGLPPYSFLTWGAVPGWLSQARQFYDLSQGTPGFVAKVLLGICLPLVFLIVIASALRRDPTAWLLVGVIAVCGAFGLYERAARSCSYCEDRSLLPILPALIVLVALGIALLEVSSRRIVQAGGLLAVLALLSGLVPTAYSSIMRYRDGAYFLDSAVSHALSHLPVGATVEIEGFGEGPNPPTEQGLVYVRAEEVDPGKVSLPDDFNEDGSLIYLGGGGYHLSQPQFDPGYGYVLTRVPGIHTDRRTVFQQGGIALEQRVRRVDVTPDYGLGVPYTRMDPKGLAFLNTYYAEPLQLVVTGAPPGPVYVSITVTHITPSVKVTSPVGTPLGLSRTRRRIEACTEAVGSGSTRVVQFAITPAAGPLLTRMAATSGRCPYGAQPVSRSS